MRYGILGSLEVGNGARPITLAQGRQRLLLAVLLLHANRPVSSERLVDALWGESPPPTAARSLHNLVSGLRKALGDGVLETQGRSYLLRVSQGELDAQRFEQLADQGRAALDEDPAQAAEALREALSLWRGPALGDLAYEPAVSAEAERLEEERLAAIEERIDADLALGRHAELVAELEALVAREPLRERLRGQQMLALYRSGRQADALAAYGDARRRLVEELGIEPGPALRRLEQAVLEQDPALGAPDPLPSPPRQRSTSRPKARPLVLAAAGAGVLAVALAALALSGGDAPSGARAGGLEHVAGNSLAAIDPRSGRVVAEVPVGGTPTSVAVGAGAVWALNADDGTVARIDPATKHVRTFGIADTPSDLAASGHSLWVGAGDAPEAATRVVRLDGQTAVARARIDLPPPSHQGAVGLPGRLAVGADAVWAINEGDDLVRVDPRRERATGKVRSLRAKAVAAEGDRVWALEADGLSVAQIDTQALRARRRIKIPAARLDAIAVGAGAVWAVDSYAGNLWRIDPGPTPLTRTISVGVGANGLAVGAGGVWVSNGLTGAVTRVDPRRNRVAARVRIGNTPRDLAIGAGAVWVSLAGGPDAVAAAADQPARSLRALPGSACGPVLSGAGAPDVLIASDAPLQGSPDYGVQPVAHAVAFVLRRHGFRAGRHRVGFQSCDAATATSGASSDPAKCAANAKAYAATPAVVGVVGPFHSGCAAVEIPILNRAPGGPLALVSGSVTDVGLTHRDLTSPAGALERMYPTGTRNFARIAAPDDAQAAAGALLARELGLGRVYVLDDGGELGRALALPFRRSARALGLPLAGHRSWDPGGAGFGALARRVERSGADGVFLAGIVGANAGPLVAALRRQLGDLPLIAGYGFQPVEFLADTSGGAADGLYLTSPEASLETLGEAGKRFVREFGATQPGEPVSGFAAQAAAATEALLDAIARSDGTRASVTRALLATRLADSVVGPLRFDANGDRLDAPVVVWRVRGRGTELDRVLTVPPDTLR